MAMPRSPGSCLLTSRPLIRIWPEEISSRPAIVFKSVDLPQPEGPTMTMNSPCATERSMPRSA